jgi:hypothetical protein
MNPDLLKYAAYVKSLQADACYFESRIPETDGRGRVLMQRLFDKIDLLSQGEREPFSDWLKRLSAQEWPEIWKLLHLVGERTLPIKINRNEPEI